ADIRERGLQLMRYVTEEPIALVRQLEQTLPQPLELAAEALEIVGARHRDRIGEGALAELADGSVELAQRPADAEGEDEDGDERERQEGRRLPQEAIACVERLRFECRHLAVDLGIALLGDPLDERRQLRETARKIGGRGGAAARRSAHDGEADTPLQPSELLERLCRVGGGVQAQLLARRAQERILRAVKLEERGIREHLIQARRALEGSHLREQLLAGARARDALDHDLLAPVRQITDLEPRAHDGIEIVEARLPAKLPADALGAGYERRRVSGAARLLAHLEGLARHPLDAGENLPHAVTVSVADVKRGRAAPRAQVLEGVEVRGRQILDVNVVADARAIGR